MKKKSPSDLRRDARRRKEHLERKGNSGQPAASSSSNPPSSTDPPSSAEFSMISETPMIIENSDVMDTESSDQSSEDSFVIENPEVPVTSVEGAFPVTPTTRNEVPVKESRNTIEHIDASTIQPNLPTIDHPEKLHVVRILICAANRAAAKQRSMQFPKSKMIGAHQSDKQHHFVFSTHVNDEYISKLKTNINKFEDLLSFKYDNESFAPDHDEPQHNHCQDCKSSGIYEKYLEAQSDSD